MQIPWTHEAPFSSLLSRKGSASCLPRQDILGLKVDGMDQAKGIQANPQHRAPTRRRACVQEHRTLPRRLFLPGLIVMTFQRLRSRRRLQSLRPSETFHRLVRHETSICRVLRIPSRPRCHGVTLVRKLRFSALHWPSNGVSLQKRGPKASTDDHPSLKNCSIFKILFVSTRTLIAPLRHIASNRYALCTTFTPCRWRSRSMDDQDPAQPVRVYRRSSPPTSRSQFSEFEFRKRTSVKLFRFRFICEKPSLGERKQKKKKKRRLISRGGFVRNLRTMLCTPLDSVECMYVNVM